MSRAGGSGAVGNNPPLRGSEPGALQLTGANVLRGYRRHQASSTLGGERDAAQKGLDIPVPFHTDCQGLLTTWFPGTSISCRISCLPQAQLVSLLNSFKEEMPGSGKECGALFLIGVSPAFL